MHNFCREEWSPRYYALIAVDVRHGMPGFQGRAVPLSCVMYKNRVRRLCNGGWRDDPSYGTSVAAMSALSEQDQADSVRQADMFFSSALEALSRHADRYWRDFGYHCIADTKALAVPFASIVVAALSAVRSAAAPDAATRMSDAVAGAIAAVRTCAIEVGKATVDLRETLLTLTAAWNPQVLATWPCATDDVVAALTTWVQRDGDEGQLPATQRAALERFFNCWVHGRPTHTQATERAVKATRHIVHGKPTQGAATTRQLQVQCDNFTRP